MRAANEFIRHQTSSQHNRSKKQQANNNNKQTSNKRTANLRPSTTSKQPLDVESTTNKITLPMTTSAAAAQSLPSILSTVPAAVVRKNNSEGEPASPILFQKQQEQIADEMLSSPSDSDSDSGSGSECDHQHSGSHHLHSYNQPQR